ncbi:MAG: bifunctional homocysteine S-methyltransferase/methylenetetrahydrofolate reductase [Myxococcota bacterium]
MSRFEDALKAGPMIADGGMGSLLHAAIEESFPCTDAVTLSHPDVILGIHARYLRAGAKLIETNTFGANRVKLAKHGLADKLAAINGRAVKLAREAREIASTDAFIAGSIGPTGLRVDSRTDFAELLHDVFVEQALALEDRGVDLFVVETFTRLTELEIAVEAVRSVSSLPIVATMTLPYGDEWSDGDPSSMVEPLLRRLARLDANVIGMNCTQGPAQMLPAIRRLRTLAPDRLIAAQPNSGLPHRHDGRIVYPSNDPAWFGRFASRAVQAGANLIGGCCGTTPELVEAMAKAIGEGPSTEDVRVEVLQSAVHQEEVVEDAEPSVLQQKLSRGEFVVSMQVDPPKGTRTKMVIEACQAFRDSGHVDCVDVNSNPMARLHMDALWMSATIEQLGVETIAHYTPRDASMMGIQGNLLGAWNFGVRNVLVITGDPSMVNGEPGSNDVYQTDAIGMVALMSQLNGGKDCFGNKIGRPPNFNIGVAVNPNAEDLDLEVARFKRKIEAGAHFAMTQVFFEWSCWERFLERLGGHCPIPVMAAVWPLTSLRLALRLHHEVPGIVVPDAVLNRLRDAGKAARAEGFALARTMLAESRERMQGAYIIAPFKRPVNALELFEESSP